MNTTIEALKTALSVFFSILSILSVILLILVLSARELLAASPNPHWKGWIRRLNIPVIPLLLIFLISSFLRTFDVLQSTDVSTPGEFFKAYLLEKEAPPPKPFSLLLPTVTPTAFPAASPTPFPAATLLPAATLPPTATQPPPTPTLAPAELSTLQPPELPRARKPALVPVSGGDPAGAQNRFRYIFFALGAGMNGLGIVLYGINRKLNRH